MMVAKPFLSFNDMCWPNPRALGEICWRIAHAPKAVTRGNMLTASAAVSAYIELVTLPQRRRNRLIAQIKEQMKLPDGPEAEGETK